MGSVRSDPSGARAAGRATGVESGPVFVGHTDMRGPGEGRANKPAQTMTRPVGPGEPGTHRPVSLRMASPWIPIIPGGRILLRQSGPRRAPYQPERPRNPIGRRAPQPSRPVPSGGSYYVTRCSCGSTSMRLKVFWEVSQCFWSGFMRFLAEVSVFCRRARSCNRL